ncbi:MAG: flagellar hook-basal body complex protein FliE [Mycobacteriales bacterium]
MSISPIGFEPGLPGLSGIALPSMPTVDTVAKPDEGFANMVTQGIENLQGLHSTTDTLAVQAATGDLKDIHDYMIASAQSGLATEMTVAVRNKAVEAFTEIMRMQV